MANELDVHFHFSYNKGGTTGGMSLDFQADQLASAPAWIHNRQTVTIAPLPLAINNAAPGGWFFGINRGSTYIIQFQAGVAGAPFVEIRPGEGSMFRWSNLTNPYVVTFGAAGNADLEYWTFRP